MWRGFYYYYLYFCIFIIDISLLEKETAKIFSRGNLSQFELLQRFVPTNQLKLAIEKDELTTS